MAKDQQSAGLWQKAKAWLAGNDKAGEIRELDAGFEGVSVSMLLGSGKRSSRSRAFLYENYHYMAGDGIISSAIRLHVTQALGGHETTGDVVFIEPVAEDATGEPKRIVEELQRDLGPLFNRVAYPTAFNGATFGDAYARIYAKDKFGVVDLCCDEMVYPPLVQPFEQGNRTVGYTISTGTKFTEKLSVKQMARMKMPRMLYVAQNRVIEKSMRIAIQEDDIDKLPILPALVGGSFLDAAEESYYNLISALTGLVGQRVLNSIDESMIGVNMESMTVEQRKEFMGSLKAMLTNSKARAEKAVKDGKPVLERLYHIMPTFNEKQMTRIEGFQGGSGGANISIDDVMLHAKMLAGALGIDLSMLGFSDILSGGLGDGGFFRVSAQAAERSRIIRNALSKFFDDVIDIHTLNKYGFVFADGERPYKVNFYGSISALETEKQHTKETATNTAMALVTVLTQLRDLGMKPEANEHIFSKVMQMDKDAAKLLAEGIKNAKPPGNEDGMGGFGGGAPGQPGGIPPLEDTGDEPPDNRVLQ
jgi:hypothetical protein